MTIILRPALVLFVLLSLVCGLLYPFVVTGIGKLAFAQQAEGSLIVKEGKTLGSSLIGQSFSSPKYFWGRPSATSVMPNNGSASGGSNQGSLNPAFTAAVKNRIQALQAADPKNTAPIPVDLVTASASGLDPEISVAAALYQAGRVANFRGLSMDAINTLIAQHTKAQYFGFLGEPRVNVLELNLALDSAR